MLQQFRRAVGVQIVRGNAMLKMPRLHYVRGTPQEAKEVHQANMMSSRASMASGIIPQYLGCGTDPHSLHKTCGMSAMWAFIHVAKRDSPELVKHTADAGRCNPRLWVHRWTCFSQPERLPPEHAEGCHTMHPRASDGAGSVVNTGQNV